MNSLTRKLEVLHQNSGDELIKVAFATTDRRQVNQHFGSARAIAIYGINRDNKVLLNVSQFGELGQDGNEDKLAIKLESLKGCCAVYCRACGASGVKQLLAHGIKPIKVGEGALIEEIVKDLQQEMKRQPSPWLAKAMIQSEGPDDSRFEKMAAEGWVD